jgi:PPM family protein phosphatase
MAEIDDTHELSVPDTAADDSPPMADRVRVEYAAATDVGKVRTNNEDHHLIAHLERSLRILSTSLPHGALPDFEEESFAFTVADGMGGMAAGEVASATAIMSGMHQAMRSDKWALRIDDAQARALAERATRYFEKIHDEVTRRSKSDDALAGMGTTLTTAYSAGFDLFTFHVGDSRVYRLHEGRLEQLTRDHTVAQLLADVGGIPREQANRLGMKHVLTGAVGAGKKEILPEIRRHKLVSGDRLLICTDGLTDMLPDDRIAEILASRPSPPAACRALVDAALEAGGRDNVTAIVVSYRSVDSAS